MAGKGKKHCPYCGSLLAEKKNEGRIRLYCEAECLFIYDNPIPASTSLVFDDSGNILLILRNCEPGAGRWALPGGFIETGESPADAARRELEEETGLKASGPMLVDVIFQESLFYNTSILIIGYMFTEFSGEIAAGDDASDARFFPTGGLPRLAFKSHESMIARALEKL
jgi:8-oxo-dGTP diphosphatase